MLKSKASRDWWFRTMGAGVALSALSFGLLYASAQADEPLAFSVPAPELVGGPWLNTSKGQPIKLAGRKGKVTIVEFWTFG